MFKQKEGKQNLSKKMPLKSQKEKRRDKELKKRNKKNEGIIII